MIRSVINGKQLPACDLFVHDPCISAKENESGMTVRGMNRRWKDRCRCIVRNDRQVLLGKNGDRPHSQIECAVLWVSGSNGNRPV